MSEVIVFCLAAIIALAAWKRAHESYGRGYELGIEHGRLLERSQQDIAAGRVHDHEDVFAELDKELDNA